MRETDQISVRFMHVSYSILPILGIQLHCISLQNDSHKISDDAGIFRVSLETALIGVRFLHLPVRNYNTWNTRAVLAMFIVHAATQSFSAQLSGIIGRFNM